MQLLRLLQAGRCRRRREHYVSSGSRTRLFWMLRFEHSHAPVPPSLLLSFPPLSFTTRFRMAQTVQRKQKRKQPAAIGHPPDSTPPAPKRVKVAQTQTARKSTGGREPQPRRRGGGGGGGGGDDSGDDGDGGNGAPRAGPSRQRMWCSFLQMRHSRRIDAFIWAWIAPLSSTQAEIPERIVIRPQKSGGTDRAPSRFARSGGTRRARTCCCAGFPLRALYERPGPS